MKFTHNGGISTGPLHVWIPQTGYLLPGHDGPGLPPDARVVGTLPPPSPSPHPEGPQCQLLALGTFGAGIDFWRWERRKCHYGIPKLFDLEPNQWRWTTFGAGDANLWRWGFNLRRWASSAGAAWRPILLALRHFRRWHRLPTSSDGAGVEPSYRWRASRIFQS